MKRILGLLLICSQLLLAQKKMKVLIIDGQNNHEHWPKISVMLENYMEETGLFTAEINRSFYTWQGKEFLEKYKPTDLRPTISVSKPRTDSSFAPVFSNYDLVVCNFGWGAAPWPESTQTAFETYIKNGGGLVVVHAADNSFPQWLAYNQMIGLGGWGDRTEKDGPYVYFDNEGKIVRDMSPGKGGSHGPQREYTVDTRLPKHPIMKGLPAQWLHTKDELYDRLRGPAENMEILASAYAGTENKGSGRHEPALMTIKYGKGRIFHTILGHADYSVQCVGFITTFLRGSEWAVTGKVKQKVPKDFPSATETRIREFKK
jgi:uncharacterized protein